MDTLKTGVIDIGNRNIKWGLFDIDGMVDHGVWTEADNAERLLLKAPNWILSSVRAELPVAFADKNNILVVDEHTALPVKNRYKTPETLGRDRLAGVCGAAALFKGADCLVIDAGTCITFDFVTKKLEYKGGCISPGLHMRLNALHTFTGRLPLVPLRDFREMTGGTTEEGILAGVIQGMIGEILHQVTYYKSVSSHLEVLLTGGDGSFFENKLNLDIFAAPHIVLSGLNEILKYNLAPHV